MKDNQKQAENNKRLEVLYKNHRKWLMSVALKLSKDEEIADELLSQLYLYLAERCDENLWYADSFNLQYCRTFIQSRFYNLKKLDTRNGIMDDDIEIPNEEYDYDADKRIDDAYNNVMNELEDLSKTKKWASAKLFQMYYFSDLTLEKLSDKIGISKSTSFINVKKIRKHLKEKIDNPFQKEDE